MTEWLYEAGIGEARAALIERGHIVEMAIEPDDGGLRVGAVCDARLVRRDAAGRALVTLADGSAAQLAPVPPALTEGAALRVEVVRTAVPEAGASKPPHVRPAPDRTPEAGPDLLQRIRRSGIAVRILTAADDALDAAGWGEALEEAARGIVARPDALLRISPTPAMTLIDIDGAGPAPVLAVGGARLAGEAVRRFAITGSIGIDLPTMTDRTDRQAAAAALDAVLPQPFERTAVNGFGFLQIVRRRERPSLVELLGADPVRAAATALLRQAERTPGTGAVRLVAAPPVIARIAARADWSAALARRIGAPIALHAQAGLAISAGHAVREPL